MIKTRIVKTQVDKPLDGSAVRQAQFSDKQKYEAVSLYKLLGNLVLVSEATGIHHHTLKLWHVSDWWAEVDKEVTAGSRAKLKGKLGKILDSAMTVVEDRLENGDYFYDQKNGKVVRRPLNAHVANTILKDSIDRSILLDKLSVESEVKSSTELIATRLLKLQQDFEKMASRSYRPSSEIIDVEATLVASDPVEPHHEAGKALEIDPGEVLCDV